MENETLNEKIERNAEVVNDEKHLQSDRGLNAFFTDNSPEKIKEFIGKIDDDKIIKYITYYKEYNNQIEAVELANRYEESLKYGGIFMVAFGLLSICTVHFWDEFLLENILKSKALRYTLFSAIPFGFFNVLNSGGMVINYFKKQEDEHMD